MRKEENEETTRKEKSKVLTFTRRKFAPPHPIIINNKFCIYRVIVI